MSDHIERACKTCGSLLHHEDNCPDKHKIISCPFCGEGDFDLRGLKRHLIFSECESFYHIETIHNPFD